MEADFWHERWRSGQIGFDQAQANPLLVRHFSRLELVTGDRVFVPLCGKSRDMGWLLANGCRVVGAELSETATQQLFERLGVLPEIGQIGQFKHYQAEGIDIFVGNLFDLEADVLGAVDAIYDRAALVALPEAMRERYAPHLMAITQVAPQLMICFEYEQKKMAGPPFSISAAEVERHYGERYVLAHLDEVGVPNGLKGEVAATEQVWLLHHDA